MINLNGLEKVSRMEEEFKLLKDLITPDNKKEYLRGIRDGFTKGSNYRAAYIVVLEERISTLQTENRRLALIAYPPEPDELDEDYEEEYDNEETYDFEDAVL
jgi:hypothetical protein